MNWAVPPKSRISSHLSFAWMLIFAEELEDMAGDSISV